LSLCRNNSRYAERKQEDDDMIERKHKHLQ
jgi:hypothetical protein